MALWGEIHLHNCNPSLLLPALTHQDKFPQFGPRKMESWHENMKTFQSSKEIIPWISLALNWRNVHCFAMEPGCFGFKSRRAPVYGSRGMVATSQPLASEVEHGRLMPWHGVIEVIAWDLRRTVQDVELAWIIVTWIKPSVFGSHRCTWSWLYRMIHDQHQSMVFFHQHISRLMFKLQLWFCVSHFFLLLWGWAKTSTAGGHSGRCLCSSCSRAERHRTLQYWPWSHRGGLEPGSEVGGFQDDD